MRYVIKIDGCEGHDELPEVGEYILEYGGEEDALGYAELVTIPDIAGAKRFIDFQSAAEFWKQQSKTVPTRSTDGKPNRPLTMYTVTIAPEQGSRF